MDYKREYTVTGLGNCSTKEKQKEAIVHFINGNDCFVSLPTGYGKSMCYGILFFVALRGTEGSIVLYVSPPTCITYDYQRDKFNHMRLLLST